MTGLFKKNLAMQLGIDDEDIAARKAMLGFTEADAKELMVFAGAAREISTRVIEEFYRRQIAIPELRRMIGDTETLARLMAAMRDYVAALFAGAYGADYVNNRLRVGQAHARLGVAPKHYIAAMALLQQLIGKHLMSSGLIEAPPRALDKLFLFDLELVFDVYLHGVTSELELLRERIRSGVARAPASADEDEAALDEMLAQAMRHAASAERVA